MVALGLGLYPTVTTILGKHSVNPVFVPSYFGVTFTTKKLCGISNRLKLSIPVTRVAV